MFLLVVSLSVLMLAIESDARLHEPSCTYVDNLEKVLEKLVRNEHKLGLFGDKVDEMESKLNEKLQKLDNTEAIRKVLIDDVVETVKEMKETLTENTLEIQQEMEKSKKDLDETKAGIKQTLTDDLKKHDVALQSLQETYKTPTVVFTARDVTENDVTKGEIIVFTTIVSNEGGAYDTNTGYFTAPYDGLYQFHATVCSYSQKQVYVHLVAAGAALAGTYKYNADTSGSCTSISGVARLSSGDKAHVEGALTQSGGLYETYKTPTVVFTARDVTENDVTKGEIIVFTTIVSNEGGAYDTNTGYFTAPYDGLYQFHATVCSYSQKQVYVHLVAAGAALAGTYKYNADTSGSCTSISGVARLSSGDKAHVEGALTQSGGLYGGGSYSWPSFSGMLVHT